MYNDLSGDADMGESDERHDPGRDPIGTGMCGYRCRAARFDASISPAQEQVYSSGSPSLIGLAGLSRRRAY